MIREISSLDNNVILPPSENNLSMNEEHLDDIISVLENEIENGTWNDTSYARMDLEMMPALVARAKCKYPEMNLSFISNSGEIHSELKRLKESGVGSSSLIVNMGEDGIHFCVVDYRCINEKLSLIMFEPANLNSSGPVMLAIRLSQAISKYDLPDCYFSIAEMDIQRSNSECGIFSLSLAKKIQMECEGLQRIHEDNINGLLSENVPYLTPDKLDPYLPASFYKHTQGTNRLIKYLKANPNEIDTIINKKNETILERFYNNLCVLEGKRLSISAHKKRVAEYKSVAAHHNTATEPVASYEENNLASFHSQNLLSRLSLSDVYNEFESSTEPEVQISNGADSVSNSACLDA